MKVTSYALLTVQWIFTVNPCAQFGVKNIVGNKYMMYTWEKNPAYSSLIYLNLTPHSVAVIIKWAMHLNAWEKYLYISKTIYAMS